MADIVRRASYQGVQWMPAMRTWHRRLDRAWDQRQGCGSVRSISFGCVWLIVNTNGTRAKPCNVCQTANASKSGRRASATMYLACPSEPASAG